MRYSGTFFVDSTQALVYHLCMVYVKKRHYTMKQMAYARRLFGGDGVSKKQIALDAGYSPYVSNSISSHIENQPGFHNAMAALAIDSNNLALAAMHEMKSRGFKDFSNKELTSALNAIGGAWSRFNAPLAKSPHDGNRAANKLRTVILQQVENQTITSGRVDEEPTIIDIQEEPDF